MGQPYVDYPGSAGRYASCASVNLLDADTAHTYQSRGAWVTGSIVSDSGSWSGKMNEITFAGAGTDFPALVEVVDGLSSATVYSMSSLVAGPDWTNVDSVSITAQWLEADGTPISTMTSAVVSNPTANTVLTVTGTSPALTAKVTVWHTIVHASGACTLRFSDMCLRAGSDGTFVPSLRIVGDLDLRARLAADDWTPASRQTFLCNDDVSTEGYRFRLEVDGDISIFHGDGGGLRTIRSTAGVGATDGDAVEIRAAIDVTSANLVTFYKDEVVLGDTVAIAAGAGVPSGDTLIVGADSGLGARLAGDVYWVEVRDGIDGPVVARMDAGDTAKATL